MSLQQWHSNGWIHKVEPSAAEVSSLLHLAAREVTDASLEGISPDGRFGHAYSAVRTLCQAALHASGYSVGKRERAHERTIESLKFTLGGEWSDEADYFDQCRRSRHQLSYEHSGITQQQDADGLLDTAKRLQVAVKDWLQAHHPDLG